MLTEPIVPEIMLAHLAQAQYMVYVWVVETLHGLIWHSHIP